MKMRSWIAFAAVPLLLAAPAPSTPALSKAAQGKIEGTWRMVSFKYGGMVSFRYGGEGALLKVGADRVMLKHITPGHFTWVDYNAKTKQVSRMAGGTFTLKSDGYQETVEYGSGPDIQALLGKGQVFNDQITATRWHHQGHLSTGLKIEENWERVQ